MINSALMAGCNTRKWIERIQAEPFACVSCWPVGNSIPEKLNTCVIKNSCTIRKFEDTDQNLML